MWELKLHLLRSHADIDKTAFHMYDLNLIFKITVYCGYIIILRDLERIHIHKYQNIIK